MRYWLFKSEPTCFSIDDLAIKPQQTTYWDGVRNYQARNMLRDQVKKGDKVLFYHSNCTPPGIAGIAEVVKEGYPDFTAWDKNSEHYDPKSTPEKPLWFMVDVKFIKKFDPIISLNQIKLQKGLEKMQIVQKGNRLSISSVSNEEWNIINQLKDKTDKY